jgi:charged multivesicular body protein 5
MEDLLEQASEVQEIIGRSYAVPDELDEADLEAGTYIATLLDPEYAR